MCADFELKALECIEYYGAKQGITACKDWYDDYIECSTGNISLLHATDISLILIIQEPNSP